MPPDHGANGGGVEQRPLSHEERVRLVKKALSDANLLDDQSAPPASVPASSAQDDCAWCHGVMGAAWLALPPALWYYDRRAVRRAAAYPFAVRACLATLGGMALTAAAREFLAAVNIRRALRKP